MNTFQTIEQMRQSPYVKEKQLRDGISSFNFTRKAFWDRHWTAATVKARGLFIDTVNNRIKARSFDKFFNIGERRETELDILAENFEYPVRVYEKYNGYLGICAGEKIDLDKDWRDKSNYRLWCASKSTDEGWYAARFEDLLRQELETDEAAARFAYDLYNGGLTAVFEVIDPKQDPHIIEYDKPRVILLALIMNDDDDVDMYRKSDGVVEMYNATWKLPVSTPIREIADAKELYDWYDEVTAPGYQLDGEYVEGFVLCDLDDHMVKVKTDYYLYWKWVRTACVRLRKGESVKLGRDIDYDAHPDYLDLLSWISEIAEFHYNMWGQDINVIELRNFWQKRQELLNGYLLQQ